MLIVDVLIQNPLSDDKKTTITHSIEQSVADGLSEMPVAEWREILGFDWDSKRDVMSFISQLWLASRDCDVNDYASAAWKRLADVERQWLGPEVRHILFNQYAGLMVKQHDQDVTTLEARISNRLLVRLSMCDYDTSLIKSFRPRK